MRYITDRKRAEGKGASGTGTEHHWSMKLSSVGLAFLVPTWVYIFGSTLGQGREAVLATFSHPFPAILTGLVLFVGMRHFAMGATVVIEDYSKASLRKILIMSVTSLSYLITAAGLFALIKIAV